MKALLVAAFAIAFPIMANAVPLPPFTTVPQGGAVTKTKKFTSFTYEPTKEMSIEFLVTGNGGSANVPRVTYGFTSDAGTPWTNVNKVGSLTTASGELFAENVVDPITVWFRGGPGLSGRIELTVSAYGTPVPIPLPATGGLLAVLLLGGGAFAFRRKTVAA